MVTYSIFVAVQSRIVSTSRVLVILLVVVAAAAVVVISIREFFHFKKCTNDVCVCWLVQEMNNFLA